MGKPILLLGASGSGKSASLRNYALGELNIINVLGKELPFRNKHKVVVTTDYAQIKSVLLKAPADVIIIDDAGYLMTSAFMRRSAEKGYEKFTDLAKDFYDLINFVQYTLPPEKIVILTMHTDVSEVSGITKPKTIGKLLDEKICIEGMFSIVLIAQRVEGKYTFKTQSTGYDVAKTPMGMFESEEIDNDLKFVTDTVNKY